MSFRTSTRVFAATAALGAGALAASVAEDLLAGTPPAPSPLARDEEFVVRIGKAVPFYLIQVGNLRVSPTPATGIEARGVFVPGRTLIDPANGRAVVVRPEAVREYFQIVKDLPRADAQVAAERLLTRVQRTGNLKPLNDVDAALRREIGPLAGSRLDDPDVHAIYPGTGGLNGGTHEYRNLIAGDDGLWHDYFVGNDIAGFATLQQNPEYERFYRTVNSSTGVADGSSVLRQREHRRVLIRRSSTYLTFMPSVPTKADLSDAGYVAGSTYTVKGGGPLRRSAKTFRPSRGGQLKFVDGMVTFTVAPDTGDGGEFLGGTPWTGAPNADVPRIVNVTPPNSEVDVDPTTDWEDPDNRFTTPIPQRRLFVIRLRFNEPLDPRTVDTAHFTLTKTATIDQFGTEAAVNVPVAVGVFLAQTRSGEIRVDITPVTILDPGARYEVVAMGSARALNGKTRAVNFVSTFVTSQ